MSKLVVHYTFIKKEMRKLLKSRMNISHRVEGLGREAQGFEGRNIYYFKI